MSGRTDGIVGAVLAGGRASRMGGDKLGVLLDGRPLLAYPLAALAAAEVDEVVVVAKAETPLPGLDPAPVVWAEADQPRHPLTGIVRALRGAGGRAVFVAAADLALLDDATVRRVCAAARPGDLAVVPRADGRLQPLCALYLPQALPRLRHFEPVALTRLVEALSPRVVEVEDPTPFFNVNAPEDLLRASALRRASTRT